MPGNTWETAESSRDFPEFFKRLSLYFSLACQSQAQVPERLLSRVRSPDFENV